MPVLSLGLRSKLNMENCNEIQCFNSIRSSSEIYKGIRRFVIKKFPYGVYYKVNVENKEIQIIGVIHFKRSSKILRKRI